LEFSDERVFCKYVTPYGVEIFPAPNGAPESNPDMFGETPNTATGTVALPVPIA